MTLDFFKQFVLNPIKTGAIAPSSEQLSNLITDKAGLDKAKVVVEFGAGTGAFTEKILNKIKRGTEFIAFEINPEFVKATKKRCPEANIINDSAVNIRKYLKKKADVIISGLPFAGFNEKLQDKLLDSTVNSLKQNGKFLTFAYVHGVLLPHEKSFRDKLNQRFKEVKKTRIVWKNLPPAFVYIARK